MPSAENAPTRPWSMARAIGDIAAIFALAALIASVFRKAPQLQFAVEVALAAPLALGAGLY
jgi:hypothetical protein